MRIRTETGNHLSRWLVAALCLVLVSVSGVARAGSHDRDSVLYVVDVSSAHRAAVARLKADAVWTAELGDVLVASGGPRARDRAAREFPVTQLDALPEGDELLVGTHLHPSEVAGTPFRVLASSGTLALLAGPRGVASPHWDADIRPLEHGRVYAETVERARDKTLEPNVYADAIDGGRWLSTVTDLANFGTRYAGTQGVLSARNYIANAFQALGLTVTTPEFAVGSTNAWNVVGELRGTTRADDVYIVCGHYDSISEDPTNRAPGAEDNGSGAGGVIELARVFAAHPPGATIRFIAFSGEEEGLYGSEFYVGELMRTGEARRVKGVLNMDMIGFSRDNDLDVLLETGESGSDLSSELAASAAEVTDLRVVKSFNPFGSDHVPFIDAGIPCVLTIQNDWDQYPAYHTSRDTIGNVRIDMGSGILRMNAATLGRLAAGPPDGVLVVTPRLPFDTNRRTLYGGFVQTIEWSVAGDNPESFDVEFSLDDGATFQLVGDGFAGDSRRAFWTVPNGVASDRVRVRVTAHRGDGTTVAATTAERFVIEPSSGPVLHKVLFKQRNGGDIVVRGLFGSSSQMIEVNGAPIGGTVITTRAVDGNTTRHLVGVVAGTLEATFPRGVEVRVRVVDLRTGLATPELAVTRQ